MKIIFLHHKSSRNLIRAAFFWPTLTRWWTLQLIRSGYYFTINQRRGRHGALSHLTALPCNLIVPELHQFPEQSIPPLAGCRQPYTLDQYAPFNMSSIVQASQPESQEAALLAWRVPGFKPVFHHSFFFFLRYLPWQVESFRVALKIKMWRECDETLEEVRWTFEPACGDSRGYTGNIKWPTASKLSLMG